MCIRDRQLPPVPTTPPPPFPKDQDDLYQALMQASGTNHLTSQGHMGAFRPHMELPPTPATQMAAAPAASSSNVAEELKQILASSPPVPRALFAGQGETEGDDPMGMGGGNSQDGTVDGTAQLTAPTLDSDAPAAKVQRIAESADMASAGVTSTDATPTSK